MATAEPQTRQKFIEQATPGELIDECETIGQAKDLDGVVADRTEEDGRVREVVIRTISDPEDITWIEPGDTIIHNYNEKSTIEAIGGEISDAPGLHIKENRDKGESPVHLTLIQRWLRKDYIAIIGTRTREFAKVE